MRTDIVNIKNLDLHKLNVKNNTIYAYRCPAHAKGICNDFCDWFLLFNNSVFENIKQIFKDKTEFVKSNEYTLKTLILKYNLNIVILGTVGIGYRTQIFLVLNNIKIK